MLQVVPFHCSAKVPEFELPTAVHAEDDLHATLAKKPPPAEGCGVSWMVHRVPFLCSAKVPEFEPPTAVHAEAEVQATLDRPPPPAGLGAGWSRQLLPFHPSATAVCTPDRLAMTPTATQADGDEQATPFKALHAAPGGLGTGWMRHVLPSHRSASATPAPELRT
jgi:hypothetical protein